MAALAGAAYLYVHLSDGFGEEGEPGLLVLSLVFAFAGSLIAAHQPRNVIGWLLMIPAAGIQWGGAAGLYLDSLSPVPDRLDLPLYLAIIAENFSWMALIFPLFHLLLVFPTGRVLSGRWRWFVWLEKTMILFLLVAGLASTQLGPLEGEWTVANPHGFVPPTFFDGVFWVVWTAGLIALPVAGLASMVIRYRRAGPEQRQQIRWLLYAAAVFAFVYSLLALFTDWMSGTVFDLVFFVAIAGIPASVAIAVVRHRLFDIDVVIRRTLTYAVVTGVLGVLFTGGVVGVQGLFGVGSDVAVAGSTLAVAAGFNPLRRKVQQAVDRRFNRSRFDAVREAEGMVLRLRNVTDTDLIGVELLAVIGRTLQPQAMGLWLRPGD